MKLTQGPIYFGTRLTSLDEEYINLYCQDRCNHHPMTRAMDHLLGLPERERMPNFHGLSEGVMIFHEFEYGR